MNDHLPPLCIYHGNCTDGFAAAWAVRSALPDAEFVSASYGSAPPDVTGRTVYVVDFSYPRDVLLAMAEKAAQIVVLDHHKTAAEQLVDLPANVQAYFDMERSGCMLAWQHFFGHELPPQLLLHIQDRDLWNWKLPHTKEILAAVFSYEHDFETWDRLMWGPIDALREEGRALLRKHDKDIGTLLHSARPALIAGYTVPTINLPPTMASDAGAILAQGQPFAAVYWDTRSGRQYSLRSAPDGIDVAEIAQQVGGGGHKHAAGFKVPFDHPLARGPEAPAEPSGKSGEPTAERAAVQDGRVTNEAVERAAIAMWGLVPRGAKWEDCNKAIADDWRRLARIALKSAAAPEPPKGARVVTEADFTREEVAEAMELLRHYRSSIPSECLDQMERVLLSAAPTLAGKEG